LDKSALIRVHTGNGKGKTTAALGLALQALGQGKRVKMIQFLKGSTYAGELWAAARLWPEFEIKQYGYGCPQSALIRQGDVKCSGCGDCFRRNREQTPNLASLALAEAERAELGGEYELIILDEVSHALRHGLIGVEQVLRLIMEKPPQVSLVLTGRMMPPEIIAAADEATEFCEVEHPLRRGMPSRRGIEY